MRSVCTLFLVVFLSRPAPSASQQPGDTRGKPGVEVSATEPSTPQSRRRFPQEEPDPLREDLEKRRQKALKKEHFTKLKRDTDKLLELATELKTQVDKADENMLSLDVLKKTEQIEKLAKSVRDKMKGY
ncbi:MAG: hypothetical protein L0099_03300 [Acidobacteria bacterium]|nr:hypothetical protein [Acidobacteriota bacterium]